MESEREPSSSAIGSEESSAILRRILDAVEKRERKEWVEIASALLLAIATVGSAWCAYQSTLWGGVQTFRLAAGNRAGRESSEQAIAALQTRMIDGIMLISFLEARGRGDQELEKFLSERFRPEMKISFDAWMKTDPFHNPEAPPHPLKMAEYVQPEVQASSEFEEESARMRTAAQEANQVSDTYVLLTVLFASVLFFGGIGGMFQSRRLRIAVMVIGLALFLVTIISLGGMPVCRE